MANLTRYDPFRDLTRFEPFRNFDDMFKGFMVRPVLSEMEPEIKMDVSEDDKA